MGNVAYIKTILPYLLGFLGILLLSDCSSNPQTTASLHTIYDGPVLDIDSVQTWYSDSAELKIHLTAPKQLELLNGNREFPKGVLVEFFKNGDSTKPSILKSNYAVMLKDKQVYKVTGNVLVENPTEQKKLTTESLFWSPVTKKISTTEQVIITTPKEVIKGIGMEANQDFSSYTIKQVTGILQVGE